jgi:serine/threonine-protein kinase
MAEVWVAHDSLLDRTVALKVLFPELSVDPNFVERFRREAQAAANLSHPNIVSVYDWGEAGNTYFIVMEYVEGRALSTLLREDGRLPAERAAAIGVDVAAALGFAHRNGVIHRDVKPGNVLITTDDHVKVTDFGIAMAVGTEDHLTQTGAVMGTATYFSPEQAQGLPVDQRSDVYALGVVLYELVTGRPPFVADGPVAVAYKHVHEAPVPPSEVVPEIPAGFEAIVLQALAKDVRQRYASAEELRADLNRFRQGRPVLADPVPRPVAPADPAPVAVAAPVIVPEAPPTGVTGANGDAGTPAAPLESASPPPPPAVEATVPGESRSSVWRYVILLLLLLVALGVVLVLLGRQLGLLNTADSGSPVLAPPPPTAPVSVPADLIGKSFTDAANEVQGLGLRYARTDVEDTQHPENTVVNTSPPAGTQVAGTGVITLDVSSGPLPITEPDVVGLDLQTATQTLQRAGFAVGPPQQQQAAYVPTGLVVSTTPPPGSQAHNGDTVSVVVSAPKGTVAVPDVSGDSQLAAAGVLVRAGFPVKVDRRVASPTVAAGDVVSTDPPAGTNLLQGTYVGFVISLGPNPARVPYVTYDSQSRAQSAIQAAGLAVTVATQAVSSSSRNGVVLSESPAPGTLVPAGSTVTLTVGQYGSG